MIVDFEGWAEESINAAKYSLPESATLSITFIVITRLSLAESFGRAVEHLGQF